MSFYEIVRWHKIKFPGKMLRAKYYEISMCSLLIKDLIRFSEVIHAFTSHTVYFFRTVYCDHKIFSSSKTCLIKFLFCAEMIIIDFGKL